VVAARRFEVLARESLVVQREKAPQPLPA